MRPATLTHDAAREALRERKGPRSERLLPAPARTSSCHRTPRHLARSPRVEEPRRPGTMAGGAKVDLLDGSALALQFSPNSVTTMYIPTNGLDSVWQMLASLSLE